MAKRNTDRDYIDDKLFYERIKEYQAECRKATEMGDEEPPLTRYLGECIYLIAINLAKKGNFSNYPFIDDMISDGIENCIKYFNNFDPERFDKPFAYYTQIMRWAFIARIKKEHKKLYQKYKFIENTNITNTAAAYQEHDESAYNAFIAQSEGSKEYMAEFIKNYEEKNGIK